jgi:DNA-3-methyladenine glycosylase II
MPEAPVLPFDHLAAIAHLTKADAKLGQLIAKAAEFRLNIDEKQSPYASLLRAIAYQSISGQVARVIYGRIQALSADGHAPTPEEILRVEPETLRKTGLSNAKVLAMRDLAQKTIDGIVPTLVEAEKMSDQELVDRLTSVRGIGAWTVEMFLMFRLGRPDVLPIHDLGVQKGFALTYRKRFMPSPKELAKFGERWRPYRTVASWYFWRAVELDAKGARKITNKTAKKRFIIVKTRLKTKIKPAAKKLAAKKTLKSTATKRRVRGGRARK